ncbi:MAG TPA: alpha-glucosidase C-terminal domain-containing protein, partial [Candidatus Hodarchaeales archaeon]|nr:alpha-glucosidase C-terminal domain-containing protein [Candidatus Hodarchaeales archaeon]
RKHIDNRYGPHQKVLLAEANQEIEQLATYFGNGEDEMNVAFGFPLMPRIFYALAKEDSEFIISVIKKTLEGPVKGYWCLFLRNHDELTLEKVPADFRNYMWETYAPQPRMKLNLGIRRRLAPLLDNNLQKILLGYSLIFSLPGSPIIYYGDEIGMGDNIELSDRWGLRTPMQWSNDINGGFSKADESKLFLQPIRDLKYGFQIVNVQQQKEDRHTLLKSLRALIRIWKANACLAVGSTEFLETGNPAILAHLRFDEGKEQILCFHNLAGQPRSCSVESPFLVGDRATNLFDLFDQWEVNNNSIHMRLDPHQFKWLKLERTAE